MKEEIYTIPVNDGFNADTECPFCAMEKALEDKTIAYVLSPSYMEEDVRQTTNEQGFCRRHVERLYKEGNSLGLALMLQTQLIYQHKEISELLKKNPPGSESRGLFKKKADDSALRSYRKKYQDSCYVCHQVSTVFERYLETFFVLYQKDAAFRDKVKASKGFCVTHYLRIMEQAPDRLKGSALNEFTESMSALEENALTRMEEEIDWFIKKFDYRYASEPWKNSKDAVPRVALKLDSVLPEK